MGNGIELNKYRYTIQTKRQVREELGVDEKTLLIGHVGRFCYPKNHAFLIDIVSQLVQVIPNCKLCLVGEGELEVSIRSKVQTLGLENKVLFLGVREDVPRILNAFDLFVFPSLLEGIPVTLIEAQASGLQCLVSNQIT
ncbi:MAG: glycosyltransferase, partial [Niameybacter sp.]